MFFFENIFLLLFFFLGIFSAFFVIFSTNPVHSVLFLILVFFNISGLLFLLGLEYFALVFLIIYIGAIAVLFLFIVMMLNIKIIEIDSRSFWHYSLLGFFFTFILFFELFIFIFFHNTINYWTYLDYPYYIFWIFSFSNFFTIEIIGELLYTYYFFSFLLSGLVLFLSMFGSIFLTMNQSQLVRRQKIYHQIFRGSTSHLILNKKIIKI